MDVEFKIRGIELLNELIQKRLQGLALRLPIHAITTEVVDEIESLCKKYPGQAALQLFIKDDYEALQVELLARTYRIKVTNALVQEFKKYAEIGVITDKVQVRWLSENIKEDNLTLSEIDGTISSTFVLDSAELINQ